MHYSRFVRTILFLFLPCLLSIFSNAQNTAATGRITGNIRFNNEVLDGATIYLYNETNQLKKTGLSDINGDFIFDKIKLGKYYLVVMFTGKENYKSEILELKSDLVKIELPVINLENKKGTQLNDVEVTSKKNFVERKIDRTVINPDALISNAGATALEVLEKAPGVQVTIDGVISLLGRPGVMIFIDDKQTFMGAADLAAYLRSMPASSIESIEIMTNPPAKYDASGNAGIINIRLKRIRTKGFNASFTNNYGQGVFARSTNSITTNYRYNKVNYFASVGYNYIRSFQDLRLNRSFSDNAGVLQSTFNQRSFIRQNPVGLNFKVGADYYVTAKSTWGIVLSGFENQSRNDVNNQSIVANAINATLGVVSSFNPTHMRWSNKSANTNFTHKINKSKEISFNLDYLTYRNNQDNLQQTTSFKPDGSLIGNSRLVSDLPSNIRITAAKVDYTHMHKKGGRFEVGAKATFVRTDNTANVYDDKSGILTPNFNFTNRFKYTEDIQAAYINYSVQKGKLGLQAGLRLENTNISGRQFGNPSSPDSSFKRSYANLFPTFFASLVLDSAGKHLMIMSLGRRIDRPDYLSMNPFIRPLDSFTLYTGNPFLQPTFSYNMELSHVYKNNFTTSLVVGYVKDVITETIEINPVNRIFYSRPNNIGRQLSFTLQVTSAIPVKKWWKIQFYAGLTRNEFKGDLYNQQLNNQGVFYVINPTNLFQINKRWSAEFAGSYQSRVYAGQFITIPVWQMRAAVSKKILKDKGTFKVGLNDMFYTMQPGGDIQALGTSASNWKSYLDSRVINFTFSYRFSKGKALNARENKSAEAEKGRVKTS